MKQLILLTLLLLCLAGCTTFKEVQATVVGRYDANMKLSSALSELEQGRTAAAASILEAIIAEPGVKGVTDEALFRLSLLRLQHEEKDGSMTAIHYLERLRRDYRDSDWAQQARPLHDFLNGIADIKKQNRNLKILNISLTKDNKELLQNNERLKNLNISLTKDNKELLQNIERLKNLDIQLERKAR